MTKNSQQLLTVNKTIRLLYLDGTSCHPKKCIDGIPLRRYINCINTKNRLLYEGNPNLNEIFLSSSVFCTYRRFTNRKDLIFRTGPCSTGLLTETIKIQVVSVARKINENVFDHLSSFICLATKKN